MAHVRYVITKLNINYNYVSRYASVPSINSYFKCHMIAKFKILFYFVANKNKSKLINSKKTCQLLQATGDHERNHKLIVFVSQVI